MAPEIDSQPARQDAALRKALGFARETPSEFPEVNSRLAMEAEKFHRYMEAVGLYEERGVVAKEGSAAEFYCRADPSGCSFVIHAVEEKRHDGVSLQRIVQARPHSCSREQHAAFSLCTEKSLVYFLTNETDWITEKSFTKANMAETEAFVQHLNSKYRIDFSVGCRRRMVRRVLQKLIAVAKEKSRPQSHHHHRVDSPTSTIVLEIPVTNTGTGASATRRISTAAPEQRSLRPRKRKRSSDDMRLTRSQRRDRDPAAVVTDDNSHATCESRPRSNSDVSNTTKNHLFAQSAEDLWEGNPRQRRDSEFACSDHATELQKGSSSEGSAVVAAASSSARNLRPRKPSEEMQAEPPLPAPRSLRRRRNSEELHDTSKISSQSQKTLVDAGKEASSRSLRRKKPKVAEDKSETETRQLRPRKHVTEPRGTLSDRSLRPRKVAEHIIDKPSTSKRKLRIRYHAGETPQAASSSRRPSRSRARRSVDTTATPEGAVHQPTTVDDDSVAIVFVVGDRRYRAGSDELRAIMPVAGSIATLSESQVPVIPHPWLSIQGHLKNYDNLVQEGHCEQMKFCGLTLTDVVAEIETKLQEIDETFPVQLDDQVENDIRDYRKSLKSLSALRDGERLVRAQETEEDREMRLKLEYYGRSKKLSPEEAEVEAMCHRRIWWVSEKEWKRASSRKCNLGRDCGVCANKQVARPKSAALSLQIPTCSKIDTDSLTDNIDDEETKNNDNSERKRYTSRRAHLREKADATRLALGRLHASLLFVDEYNNTSPYVESAEN